MSKGQRWLWLVCLTVGLFFSVSSAMGSWYLVDDFSGGSLDTNRWIVTTTTTSEGSGSVSVVDGRMMCLSPTRYTTAMAALKVGDDKYFSLNDVGGTLQIAYDFQVAADTERSYNNGVWLLDNANATKYVTLGYGSLYTARRVFFGSAISNYTSTDAIWTGRQLHVELTTDASTSRLKVFNVDPNATGPDSYTATTVNPLSTTPGALLVDLTTGTSAIASLDQLLYFQVAGSSNVAAGLSRVYFDNLYTSVQIFQVSAPQFTPAKYVTEPTDVTISSATEGTTIYYTINGGTPTTGSMQYAGSVRVYPGDTLKAIAVANGYRDSKVSSVTYTKPYVPLAFLHWSFNDGTPGPFYNMQVIPDATGQWRYGYAVPGTGTLDRVALPLPGDAGNYALRFNTFHGPSYITQRFTIADTPANSFQVVSGYFSSGVSARVLASIDTPVSAENSDTYQCLFRLFDDYAAEFGLYYSFEPFGGSGNESGFKAQVMTSTGLEVLKVAQSTIEAQLGYGIIGKPAVFLITWSPSQNQLCLYIDGQLVASKTTTGTITLSLNPFFTQIGNVVGYAWNRLCTCDDFKIWRGALSSIEAQYDMLAVPAPTFMPARYITGPTNVTISSEIDGASIYYTTDGSDPAISGNLYTGPVPVNIGAKLKAIAVAQGYRDSTVNIVTYDVQTIPIVAWYGLPVPSVERFQEMRDAGFTHQAMAYYTLDATRIALDCALEAGIKLFVNKSGTLEQFIPQVKDYLALEGYFLQDEPSASDFDSLATQVQTVQSLDPNHSWYIDLYPTYASSSNLGTSSYQDYVDTFLSTVPVETLSFNHYPIKTSGIRSDFYENLEIISAAARDAGIPFWAFANSVAHSDYPVATLTHLRFQMFSNLAYGAQGVQYFTYWQPVDYSSYIFHDSPIDINGNRTATYTVVQDMNEEIKGLSKVFLGAIVQSVGHTGSRPSGTTAYTNSTPINSLTTSGSSGAVVSRLVNGSNNYLVVVNRDINNTMTLTVSVDTTKNFSKVSKDGTKTALTSGTVSYTVNPADIVILNWGTPTLAVTPSSRSVAADAGTTTFAVSNSGGSTMSWSAQVISGSNWASITSGSSGINEGTIGLSYAANTSITSRTATIRITSPGSTTTDVTIVQAAADLMPGDANGDGAVDVGDLGILAANYGGTGKNWPQGDFNGDGLVDVGDLGILAANYGTGSSSACDFDADYAKVFGTSSDEADSSNDDTESTLCSALGLPLIAGLVLMGLMLVKLEE